MVKRCCYGTCNTDSRYKERLVGDVKFFPFPKPATNLDKCRRWIKLCGRPHHQLNEEILRDHGRAKHFYVCSKHFTDGKPTKENTDPQPALRFDSTTPARRPPMVRALSEPTKKRRRLLISANDGKSSSCSQMETVNNEININETNQKEPEISSSDLTETPDEQNDNTMLEMLALAAENDVLRQQIAKLILENEKLLRNSKPVQQSVNTCHFNTTKLNFSASTLKQNKKKDEFVYYTGLTQEQFSNFHNFLVPSRIQGLPFSMPKNLSCQQNISIEDQLLIVMMKLRQDFDFVHIGNLFNISQQDASDLFKNWINYIFFRCSSVSIWPHRDTIIRMMPENYRKEFPTTLVIIDGTEIKIQRPSSITRQSQCYSDYKSCNTVKGLVGIEPRGGVIFASMLFTGSISDTDLTEKSGFLTTLEQLKSAGKIQDGDGIMVDKGFRIQDHVTKIGLKLNIPPFANSGSQMSSADIKQTEKIARHRVHVERAIARIKSFKILSNRFPLSLFSCIDQIWFVCCFVTNFMNYLIK